MCARVRVRAVRVRVVCSSSSSVDLSVRRPISPHLRYSNGLAWAMRIIASSVAVVAVAVVALCARRLRNNDAGSHTHIVIGSHRFEHTLTEDRRYYWDTQFCNIERRSVSSMYHADFVADYAGKKPIILTGFKANLDFRDAMSRDSLLAGFGNTSIVLSASNSYTKEKRYTTLRDYMTRYMHPVSLDSLGNETFYLFGDNYGPEWDRLMQHHVLNPFVGSTNTASMGVGARGSGVPFHFHGGGFSEVFHGRKRWFLSPPAHPPPFNPNASMLSWVEQTYPSLDPQTPLWECTIDFGSILYFPSGFWHGVLNLDDYTAFVSTFTQGEDRALTMLME